MANVGDLSVQLKADDNASSKISDAAKRINGSLGTIKKGAVIASAAILGGFTLSVKQFLDTGDELHKLAQRTGMTARELDALGHFAELSGQEMKIIEVLTKFLNKQMVSLSEGAVVQTEAFGKLGFTFQNLADMAPTERMIELIAALADVESATQQDIIGFDIFGGQMIKVKNLIGTFTGKELKEFITGLKDNSFWTDKTAEEAAVFNDTIADTKRELNMVVLELVRGHIPAMQRAAGEMLEFVKLNKDAIFQTAKMVLTFAKVVFVMKSLGFLINTFLIPAYKGLIILKVLLRKEFTLGTRTMSIWSATAMLVTKTTTAIKNAFLATKAAVVAFRVSMLITMATAIAPFLPIVVSVTAIIGLLVTAFYGINKVLDGALINSLKTAWEWVKGLGEKLGFLKTAWEKITEAIGSVTGWFKDSASAVKDRLIPSFEDVIEVIDPLQEDFEGMVTTIDEDFIPAIDTLQGSFGDLATVVAEETKEAFDGFNESLQDFVTDEISLDAKLNKTVTNLEKVKQAADDAAKAFDNYRKSFPSGRPQAPVIDQGPYGHLTDFPSFKSDQANVALLAAVRMLPSMKGKTNADMQNKMNQIMPDSGKNIFAISDAALKNSLYKFDQVNAEQPKH